MSILRPIATHYHGPYVWRRNLAAELAAKRQQKKYNIYYTHGGYKLYLLNWFYWLSLIATFILFDFISFR